MYPKVLIIGQSFNTHSGGGITLTNLFKDWSKNNIAVAAEQINEVDISICSNYYQLGYSENKRRFPFNIIQKKYISGPINPTPFQYGKRNDIINKSNKDSYPRFNAIYDSLLYYSGLYHYSRKLTITEAFIEWVNDFNPDIIYTQLASIELINFINELYIKTKTPFAIHIMDDWPLTISKTGLLKHYWRSIIDKRFRIALSNASVLLSISEAMTDEYLKRYNKIFYPFHNPIDIERWENLIEKRNDGKITVLYTGRVGIGVNHSLLQIVKTINLINEKTKYNIKFIIQNHQEIKWIKKYSFVNQRFIENYSLYPKSLQEADILILPYDFTKKSIIFIKYSFPTKASEYMISGTPILVYAPKETAISKHALEHQWAKVVNENSVSKIEEAIIELISNETDRVQYAENARRFAIENFDSTKVRERFRNSLKNLQS